MKQLFFIIFNVLLFYINYLIITKIFLLIKIKKSNVVLEVEYFEDGSQTQRLLLPNLNVFDNQYFIVKVKTINEHYKIK